MRDVDSLKEEIQNSKIVIKSVKELVPYAKNSRKHSPSQIKKVSDSIKHFGFTNPVLVKPDGGIIAGHCRVLAAKKLGLKDVPCIELSLNDQDARAYVIADNQLALVSEWDDDILKTELSDLSFENFDIELIGFDNDFLLDLNISSEEKSEEGNDDSYTKKIEAPIYEIKGEKPKTEDLFDFKKAQELIDQINKTEIPEKEKQFLRFAAYRHIVFNYESIAEYYAHAPKDLQQLMENSALVIIDFDKAIENGFVKMSKHIAEAYGEE